MFPSRGTDDGGAASLPRRKALHLVQPLGVWPEAPTKPALSRNDFEPALEPIDSRDAKLSLCHDEPGQRLPCESQARIASTIGPVTSWAASNDLNSTS